MRSNGECSFIGQRHYTGLSGEIHGRYGHGTDAYPRENCIAPDTYTLYSMTIHVSVRWRDEGVVGRERRPGSIWMCSLGGKVGGGEGGRGDGGMVVLRGEDARRKAAVSEGGAVGERRGRSGAGRAAPSGGIGAVRRRRGCGKVCRGWEAVGRRGRCGYVGG